MMKFYITGWRNKELKIKFYDRFTLNVLIRLKDLLRRTMMALILIVDDDPLILKLLNRFFKGSGHETITASDGKEALALYKEQEPDLVLTDIIMPEKDGLETIIELRRMNPELKIIAISGGGSLDSSDYLNLAKKLGANYATEKPIKKEELLAIVDKVLKQNI